MNGLLLAALGLWILSSRNGGGTRVTKNTFEPSEPGGDDAGGGAPQGYQPTENFGELIPMQNVAPMNQPPTYQVPNPGDTVLNPWGGMPGSGATGGSGSIGAGSYTTPSQLSAANYSYNQILGALPRAYDVHLNTIKRVQSWHRRVFHF